MERDNERRLPAPPRLGDRVLERLLPPRERDFDLRRLLGDLDNDGDLRPLRLGDRDTFLFGEGELLRRFGEWDKDLRLLGDFDLLRDFDLFFNGVTDGEVDLDRRLDLFCDFWNGERDFFFDFGGERDLERESL